MKYHSVVGVEAREGHKLLLQFDNNERRVFNVTPLLITVRFRESAAREASESVRIGFDTVEWENGLDLDPEYLYEKSVPERA